MRKICNVCDPPTEKAITEFPWKYKSKGIRRSYCRTCARNYLKKHYADNTEYYKQKARIRNSLVRKDNKERLIAYLREHPCVDCKEANITVLDFDHVDHLKKRSEVTRLAHCAWSWAVVELEIQKCEVRCANCHRKRTAKQFNWAKALV
jgi:hypothetical protein